jgi:hypothetical protein
MYVEIGAVAFCSKASFQQETINPLTPELNPSA